MAERKTRANPSAVTGSNRRKKPPARLVNGPPTGMDPGSEVAASSLGDIVAQHGQSLADLGSQVDSLLNRQEWILAGLYDLNVSLASLSQANGTESADPAADRCDDMAVHDVQLGTVDLGLIGLHHALVLPDELLLGVDLLAGDGVLGGKRAVAGEILLRRFEQRLIAQELALRLIELEEIGPAVDLG